MGSDCSIDLRTGPRVGSLGNSGLCDVRTRNAEIINTFIGVPFLKWSSTTPQLRFPFVSKVRFQYRPILIQKEIGRKRNVGSGNRHEHKYLKKFE